MSSLFVPTVEIREIAKHPNADRLELVTIAGWNVVVQKDVYKPGDMAVYVPVDTILPSKLEERLFPPGSKIKLHKSRIRSIRIRGIVSQGMLIPMNELTDYGIDAYGPGEDVAEILGITKYEPPSAEIPSHMHVKTSKKITNPNFHKYTDVENIKWYPNLFNPQELVYISEKMHGTSFRCGWFKNEANTLWKKVKKFFGLLDEWEFCWGSRNVQIQGKLFHKGYYEEDLYTKMVKQYDLKNLLPKGFGLYGEIIGDGVQKNYTYGCGQGEHRLVVYDIMKDNKYLPFLEKEEYVTMNLAFTPEYLKDHNNWKDFVTAITAMRLDPVPLLYCGPYSVDIVEQMKTGDSVIGGQKVREGCVVKPVVERDSYIGRKVLKAISDDYYMLKDGTDFH